MKEFQIINCPLCKQNFKREIEFRKHIVELHDVSSENSDDVEKFYIQHVLMGNFPTCACSKECTEKLTWYGWKKNYTSTYVKGHNARVDSIYLKGDRQKEFSAKRKAGYASGRYAVWNKGLTNDLDSRVREMHEKASITALKHFGNGTVIPWQKGKTSETDERIFRISRTRSTRLASGEIKIWNDGLTKETSESVASAARKTSEKFSENRYGNKRFSQKEVLQRCEDANFVMITPDKDYRNYKVQQLIFECKNCKFQITKSLKSLELSPFCPACNPAPASKFQVEIFEWMKTLLCTKMEIDTRKIISPYELDIWVPEKRFAVEYHGLYWHSETRKESLCHENKQNLCITKDINLLQIFEDEWRDKQSIIKSMILHRLRLNSLEKIGARKCAVQIIDESKCKEFLEENHLDGHVRAQHLLGLYSDTRLLAVMTLRTPFHKSRNSRLEVARFAVLSDVSVPGALGKLSKAALQIARNKNLQGLTTYVDKRIGAGQSYTSAGWQKIGETQPRFWWTDYEHRYNRFKFRADSKQSLSERQVAENAGVVKIYGCGNIIFTLNV